MSILSLMSSLLFVGCGEETPKEYDLSMYCGNDSTQNLISEDSDCDSTIVAEDC